MSVISQPFGPLCEGFDPDLRVEAGWVQQGNKVFFTIGERSLCESASPLLEGTTIVESLDDLELIETIDERTGHTTQQVKDGRWFVEGPFQRSDVKNANRRFYPRVIWERDIANQNSEVQKNVKAGGMLGLLEHPKDGRTDGKEGALVTRRLDLRKDGVVWGVAELLDTPNGLILQEYTRKGVRWGISSRGNGSVDDTGRVNENDYRLESFDGVMKPSTDGAYPRTTQDSRVESAVPAGNEVTETAVETPGGTPYVTEDARTLHRDVTALCETDLSGLDSQGRLGLARQLVQSLNRVNSLQSSQALSAEGATELRDWLTHRLQAVHESAEIEHVIADAVGGSPEEAEDTAVEAFKRVISSMQARNEDLARENVQLREDLQRTQRAQVAMREAAESRIAELLSQASPVTENAESETLAALRAELAETHARLSQAEAQLRVANDLVADRFAVDTKDPVDEAVQAALTAHPALAEFAHVLRESDSPAQVAVLVERLTAAPEPSPTVPLARRALPIRMVVESEVGAEKRSVGTNPSKGAALAGAVVTKLSTSAAGQRASSSNS